MGAATSIMFVATKVLSQGTCVCCMTKHIFCCDKSMLVATKLFYCTYVHPNIDPALSVKCQQNHQPFYTVQLNAHGKELVPYLVLSPSDLSMCLIFLQTKINKRQRIHLVTTFTDSKEERISYHWPTDKQ